MQFFQLAGSIGRLPTLFAILHREPADMLDLVSSQVDYLRDPSVRAVLEDIKLRGNCAETEQKHCFSPFAEFRLQIGRLGHFSRNNCNYNSAPPACCLLRSINEYSWRPTDIDWWDPALYAT